MIVLLGLTGCAATIEEDQKERIRQTFGALPPDVTDRLQAGELKLHPFGPTATDGYGTRTIQLPQVPAGRGSRAAEIATCRAAVRGMGRAATRLYFRPDVAAAPATWAEATEPLCERGLFSRQLRLGVTEGGAQVLDTGVDLTLFGPVLQAWGFGEPSRGQPMTVQSLDPAEVDPPLSDLPWVHRESKESRGLQTKRFQVPVGTRLQVVAECPVTDRPTVIRVRAGGDGQNITFEELLEPEQKVRSEDPGLVRCGRSRTVELEPVLSYRRSDGQEVDQVQVGINNLLRTASTQAEVRVERVG